MIKYLATSERIEKVDITRETDKSVFFENGRRESKCSEYGGYFDTWQEAHRHLLAKAHKRVGDAEARFRHQCEKRVKIENLKEEL